MAGGDSCSNDSEDHFADAPESTEKLIVNELLTSAKHAIDTGKSSTDIIPSFLLFYDDKAIKSAHEALSSFIGNQEELKSFRFSSRSRKTDKEEAKSTDIKNIVEALRKIDWKCEIFPFVASDISKVCYVYGSVRDEIQMRSEIHRINNRLAGLEELLQGIPGIANRIDAAVNSMKVTPPTTPDLGIPNQDAIPVVQGFSFKDKLLTKKVVTTIPKEIQRAAKHTENTPTADLSPPSPSWKTVVTKRLQKKRKQPIVGMNESSTLLSSDVRPMKLFVTRCHSEMKHEDLQNHLTINQKLKIISIDKLTTRFNTYSSWKIVINRVALEKCDIMKPDNWPKGTLVYPFIERRPNSYKNQMNNMNEGPSKRASSPPSPSWRR